jgi:hypothetical protein
VLHWLAQAVLLFLKPIPAKFYRSSVPFYMNAFSLHYRFNVFREDGFILNIRVVEEWNPPRSSVVYKENLMTIVML